MKPEEASQAIRDSYIPKMFNALEEALEVAIEALEKQIQKKPKTDGNRILCPTCNLLIAYNKSIEQHCWTCGQNLEGCVIK